MAASTIPKVRRDGTLVLADSGASNSYTVAYEDGDMSFSAEKADRVVIRDRGTIVGVRSADDPVLSFSFSVHQRDFTDASNANIVDVIEQTGSSSSWTSVGNGTAFAPYMLDVTLTIEGTDHGDSADHTAKMSKCILTWDFAEGDPNKISVKGECFGGLTFTGQS